ncbi:MAG TPA: hypothetical protein VFZ59_02040 [Verrucomicrobiae bacterium]|nr:hypothetical protein [Verrucomicrobiae bacterium]
MNQVTQIISMQALRIDLRADQVKLREYFRKRVAEHNAALHPLQVGLVSVGFQFDQSGWVALYFDTRRPALWDGEWTVHLTGNTIEHPTWFEAVDKFCEGEPFEIIDLAGVLRQLSVQSLYGQSVDAYFSQLFGTFILDSMRTFVAQGIFSTLPKVPRCPYVVESLPGGFTWPSLNEYGTKNIL